MEIAGVDVNSTAAVITRHLVSFALFIPAFAVGARRLHDIGRSGRWQCLMFTVIGLVPLIIWWMWPGGQVENRYGPPAA